MSAKKKLNIVHLHWGFPPLIGGVETHLTIILPELVKLGHKVSLLTGSVEGIPGNYEYEGVNIQRTPLFDLNWLYKRGFKGLEEELEQLYFDLFSRTKPDVIHAHNMHYFSEMHTSLLESMACKFNSQLILTAHNVWDDILYLDMTLKVKWDKIIAVSHCIKKEMIGIGVDEKKITVIHHGINQNIFVQKTPTPKFFDKYPKLKGRPVIFHPARMGLAKGCDISIKSINIVKKKYPDAVFVFAGSKNIIDWGETQQKDIAYLVKLIKHFKLENNVLIDTYSLEEMKEMYAATRVVIYPSTANEPFGLAMLEAMAMSKPIIVTDMGGMPEIIKDGINGFVIKQRDFEALGHRIIRLLDDEALSSRLGTTGRQILESHYTKEKMAQATLQVYEA
ncbi:MAG: glycosyltransferase family 4 protein [Candidatus Omnitrophica bacterium]|nr:glycosyltransferase family 4 protein [Candidatus Omnitrophota bacterium]